jgi:hypothetical protein
MAVNFPLNPVDEQRYPDLVAGEPALDNGRVYVYDAAKGIWNLDISEGSGEFLLKHGHDVDDCTAPVVYSWNYPATFKGGPHLTFDASSDFTVNSDWLYLNASEKVEIEGSSEVNLKSDGNITLTAADDRSEMVSRTIEDTARKEQITNKEYVDNRDHILQQEIIKVQEEINALAPSTDRGIWKDAATQIPPEGHFSMRVSGGGVTADYTNPNISLLVIHRTDTSDGYHSFENDEIGDQIQLFDVEDQNYGLFEITGKDDQSNADYVSFDVKHLGGLGETHPEDDVIIRLFKPPSGGTASEFVKKLGDDMEGPLVFKEGGIIDGRTAQSMPATPGDPSNPGYRAGLELRTTADKPVAISADGSYKSVLDIYRYDNSQPNNRGKTLSMYANGNVITPGYFQTSEYVETPIVQSKNTDDLQLKRGSDIKLEIKSNIVEVNSELQVNQGIKLVSDGSDSGRTILYHKDSDLSVYQNRITFNKRGSASDTSNSGGGALWFRRDSLATTTLTWGKAGLTLTNYADQKFNVNQVRVYNVPDPVDEQDATNKRYVDLLSAKIEELEAKIANLDGSGSSQMSNSYRIFSQYTNSSDESIYTNYFGTNSPAMYEVNTFTINQRNLIIKSGGKLTVTKASPGTRSSVFHYDIIDVQLKTNISSNSSSYQEYWYLTVVPCGMEGGFADYSNFQYDTSYYLTFSEGSVGGSRLKNNEIELVGLGRPVESEDEVVEYAMTRLDRDGNLSNIYNYIYGHFVPDSYIKSATGLEILSIDNATAYIESNSANFERATINGIPGYKIWQGSSRNNFFTRTRIMNSIHRIAQ